MYSYVPFVFCLIPAVILRILCEFYHKKDTFLFKMLMGTAQIVCIAAVNILLVLLMMPDAGSRYTAIFAAVVACLVGIMVHFMNLIGTKKRGLSELQKAELMDL